MKKINGHFLKGTVKRVCGVLAIAAALAVTPVIFDGCQNQTGTEQSGQKEYDANGWNINDPADLINGLTGTQYDQAGYDRAGYNQAGYDKEGYNKAGYNQYGWNKDGQNINGTNYDANGFKIDGTYLETGSPYDSEGYNRDGYNSAGYNRDGYNSDGYDSNGYDIDGYDVNGYNAAGYDIDGYDADGYDVDGWHRDPTNLINKFTGTNYGLDGNDRNGNPNPTVIPTYGDMNVELGTVYGGFSQYNIRQTYPSDMSNSENRILVMEMLYTNWFPQLEDQAENLNEGYSKAASKYPAYSSQFSGIAASENQTMTNIMLNGGNVTGIVDSVFGADTTNKDKFNAELAAYQQGHYINKKQRVDNTYSGNPQTRLQMTATLKTLLSGLDLTAQVIEDADGITSASLTAILEELKDRLLTGLDNATGVGITPVITGGDQAKIQALNAHLLQQIGDDRGELKALIDDLANVNYTATNISNAISYGGFAMGPQKAGQLNNDFNFDLEFLKPGKDKDTDIQMA